MDQNLGTLYAELALRTDQLNDGSKKSQAIMKRLNDEIDGITQSINVKLESIGRTMTLGVTAPLTYLGFQAAKTFASFEQAMQNTYSVMSASTGEMELLRETAERMGAETRFSASQAADALYYLGSAGLNAQKSIASLGGVLQLAGATQSDLAFTSATLASTLSQFNLDASQSGRVADVFANAIGKSQATMQKLAMSMRYVGPIAQGFNMSLEGTTGALMALYNAGYQGEQAGTIMRGGLSILASQTSGLDEKLAKLGLTYAEVNPASNDFASILDKIKSSGADTSAVLGLFGMEAGAGMAKLVSAGGDAVRAFDTVLQSSEGAAAAMQAIQNTSMANVVDEMQSAWEGLQITLVDNIAPAINNVMMAFTKVLQVVNELPPGFQVAGTTALTFAAIAGPIILVAVQIGKLKKEMIALNLVMAKNPFIMWATIGAGVITVIAGIVTAVKSAQEEYAKFTKEVAESAKKLVDSAVAENGKGNTITGLLEKYESLKGKVNESASAQREYNEVVKELEKIVPGVIVQTDAFGNALEINTEKARAAAQVNYEIAKQDAELALIKYTSIEKLTQQNVDKLTAEKKVAETSLAYAKQNQAILQENFKDRQTELEEFELLNRMKREGIKLTTEQAARLGQMKAAQLAGQSTYKNEAAEVESAFNKANTALNKQVNEIGRINTALKEQNQIILDGEAARATLASLNNGGTVIPKKELTKQAAAIEATKKAYASEFNDLEALKKEAALYGNEYNLAAEKAKKLEDEIRKLLALKEGKDIDLAVKTDNPEVEKMLALLRQLKIEAAATKGAVKKINTDSTQGDQLKELDKQYAAQIAAAKSLGKDTYDIEQEWYTKRLALLEGFHVIDIKGGMDAAKSLSSMLSGTGKTLEQFLVETKAGISTEMEALIQEMQKNQTALDEAKARLANVDFQLLNVGSLLSPEDIAAFKLRKEELISEIADLEDKLGNDTRSQVERSFTLAVNTSDIDAAKAALGPYIAQLTKERDLNKEDTAEWKKKQGEIDAAKGEVKKLRQAQADSFNAYAVPIANMGTELASVIAKSIEAGGLDGLAALQGAANMVGQIGTMMSDPMVTAVAGAAGSAIGAVATIYSAYEAQEKATADRIKKYNEESTRAAEEAYQKQKEYADAIAGDTAEAYGKIKISGNASDDDAADFLLSEAKINRQKKLWEDLKNQTAYYTTEYKQEIDEAGHWHSPTLWNMNWEWIYTTYKEVGYEQARTLNEAITNYENAKSEEDAAKWLAIINAAIEKAVGDQPINLAGFASGIEDSLTKYVRGEINLDDFKTELREKIKDAVLSQLMDTMLLSQINDQINASYNDTASPGEITAEEMAVILATATTTAEEIKAKWASAVSGIVDSTTTGLAAISKEWEELAASISESLTQSLGTAAFDADWSGFKSSFAAEMKKAIVMAALANMGIASKVTAIIDGIMGDGAISPEEILSSIATFQGYFDGLEASMAPLAAILAGLTETTIETKASGTIIQNLSGADRDFFAEMFKTGFSLMDQTFDFSAMGTATINATQLIINAVTFNHDGNIYITAGENYDLKALMGELITQAMGSR